MAGRITELVALTAANAARDDKFEITDISAGASGSKSITVGETSKLLGYGVNVLDFGAVPNDSSAGAKTVNAAAFAAAHDSFGGTIEGGTIIIPAGDFYFTAAPWAIEKHVNVIGYGMVDDPAVSATRLIFPANTTCIRVRRSSSFRDLSVYGTVTASTTGHGIHAARAVYLERINVRNFAQDGIRITASGDVATDHEYYGNANCFSIKDCFTKENGNNGLFIDGNDANAGLITNLVSENNGYWCIHDSGKYQNTYIQCLVANNIANIGTIKDANDSGCAWINCYVEGAGGSGVEFGISSIVIGGQIGFERLYPWLDISGGGGSGAQAVAIVNGAGTIDKVFPTEEGSGYSGTPAVTLRHGSGSSGAVTANRVGDKITSYTITNAGSGYHASGFARFHMITDGSFGGALTGRIRARHTPSNADRIVDVILHARDNDLLNFTAIGDSSNGFQLAAWNEDEKTFDTRHGNTPLRTSFRFATDLSTGHTGGRSAALTGGSLMFPLGFWLGTGTNARQIKNAAGMPSSGEYARGDFVFNTAPAIDGSNMIILGWSRLVTGTAHVAGTDWGVCRVSHVSPAT